MSSNAAAIAKMSSDDKICRMFGRQPVESMKRVLSWFGDFIRYLERKGTAPAEVVVNLHHLYGRLYMILGQQQADEAFAVEIAEYVKRTK